MNRKWRREKTTLMGKRKVVPGRQRGFLYAVKNYSRSEGLRVNILKVDTTRMRNGVLTNEELQEMLRRGTSLSQTNCIHLSLD